MKLFLAIMLSLTVFEVNADALNLYADSAHAPFYLGVASGDPTSTGVIIWTHLTTSLPEATVGYEVATDSLFNFLVSSGSFATNDSLDHTVKIDVSGLNSNTSYYYRFLFDNRFSAIGKTKTAPESSINNLIFAVVSCSSIYSGYFNAYRQIANLTNLDGVIHLGDYIYDDMVTNEEVRVPDSLPVNPQNLADWRRIHKFWLLDPDLRLVRQSHPFIQLWDNHDTDGLYFDCEESAEAFMNYIPVRQNPNNFQKIYRKLSYGNLVDILILDVALWRGIDSLTASEDSYLGNEQFNWFSNEIKNSTAKWKIIGSQKMVNNWSIGAAFGGANQNAWDGFPAERSRVLNLIDSNTIENVMFISGDSHVSMAADLPYTPYTTATYNQTTGEGSLCVEFAPPSVSRGNFDEKGIPEVLVNTLLQTSYQENKHHVYAELIQHGYGLLRINQDSVRAQFWYCDIEQISASNTLGKELILMNGENHWKRNSTAPNAIREGEKNGSTLLSKLYPNPANDEIQFDIKLEKPSDLHLSIDQVATSKKISHYSSIIIPKVSDKHIIIPVQELPNGLYMLTVECENFYKAQLFIIHGH